MILINKDLKIFCYENKVSLCGLVEIKIKVNKVDLVFKRIFFGQSGFMNYRSYYNGRIWIIWDFFKYNIDVLVDIFQLVNCKIMNRLIDIVFFKLFVYVFNFYEQRDFFWDDLYVWGSNLNVFWIVVGDFNVLLDINDRIKGKLCLIQ